MKIDISHIAQRALGLYPSILHNWLPGGRLNGHEYECGSLQGERGESCRVNTRTGAWADFASNERGGDPVSLYAAIHRLSQLDAARALAEILGETPDTQNFPRPKPRAESTHTQVIPAPETPPVIRHRLGKPVASWQYRAQDGGLIGYIHRFNTAEGKKEIVPQIYARGEDGTERWVWKSFTVPRPLYNLPALNERSTVLLVEGEKAADAAAALFPRLAVLTWPGGSKATGKTDFSPLAGRKVILWPDNDKPGFDAMNDVAERLRVIGCNVRFVQPPADAPEAWDAADYTGTPDDAEQMLRACLCESLRAPSDEPDEPPPYDTIPDMPPAPDDAPALVRTEAEAPHILNQAPFRCLGYDKVHYFYLAAGKQQVVALTASMHTPANLLQIADLNFWQREFPKGKSQDFDTQAAANAMMRMCERRGIFSAKMMRGRGAWYDDGHIVMHLGDRVIVDNQHVGFHQLASRYIYEAAVPMRVDLDNPLSTADANKFVQLMDMLPWERPIYSKLAAGWCVLAHIGGVLKWRPHIWVIGPKGSGKTTLMSQIIRPVLGDNLLFVQGASTEAGIRQDLGADALPVLFDEAEGEGQAQTANLQRVLQLVRQSSSETGGKISKGTPSGTALNFQIRSCFAFSSINTSLVQQSDKSRVTILSLNARYKKHEFPEIVKAMTLLDSAYIRSFYARSVALAAVIRDNGVTFAQAAAAVLGEQRAGDQIGALLAGAYALHSNKRISFDDAVAWVNQQDWSEQREEISGMRDDIQLVEFLLTQKIRVRTSNGEQLLPIGLLVDIATHFYESETGSAEFPSVDVELAKRTLLLSGFKIADNALIISNKNPHVFKLLEGTAWAVNYSNVLRNYPGSTQRKSTYFGYTKSETTATVIPLDVLRENQV